MTSCTTNLCSSNLKKYFFQHNHKDQSLYIMSENGGRTKISAYFDYNGDNSVDQFVRDYKNSRKVDEGKKAGRHSKKFRKIKNDVLNSVLGNFPKDLSSFKVDCKYAKESKPIITLSYNEKFSFFNWMPKCRSFSFKYSPEKNSFGNQKSYFLNKLKASFETVGVYRNVAIEPKDEIWSFYVRTARDVFKMCPR